MVVARPLSLQTLHGTLSFEKCLDLITEKLRCTNAVRSLCTAEGNHPITTLKDIQSGDHLVARSLTLRKQR